MVTEAVQWMRPGPLTSWSGYRATQ